MLLQNGHDTLNRIRGAAEPMAIGTHASSVCIRMISQYVKELYRRVPIGTRVIVLAEGT